MSELTSLSLENVSYSFGNTPVVRDFTLNVEPGSFTTFLGPSGCGKTTLLRLISGFLTPQQGIIKINGIDQAGIPPNVRKVGLVFQDFALFPHLTVRQNLLYGLKVRKEEPREHWEGLVHQTARILGIAALLDRYPHQLSGGQQQRVALGRSLILKPSILLMDEPLSSLDAKLRTLVREELREIQQELGITTVYVTHDQEEALSLSDSVAVINHGRLLQWGSPRDVYFTPKDAFVADFVGRANLIDSPAGKLVVRPEWFTLVSSDQADLEASLVSLSFLGQNLRLKVKLDSGDYCTVDIPSDGIQIPQAGDRLYLKIKRSYRLD